MTKIAILQPNFLPWKGVFDLINQVDIFVFLDDVEYTKRDWRNRNKIKNSTGTNWISVPVVTKHKKNQLIMDTNIDNTEAWQKKHYNAFELNYHKALFYNEFSWILNEIYKKHWSNLSDLNIFSTKLIANLLKIKTNFVNSSEINVSGQKDDKLINICKELHADHYISGPAGKNYIIDNKFTTNNIKLEYIEYKYPHYQQVYLPFQHNVTILDTIFNCGKKTDYYIWGWRNDPSFNGSIDFL